MKIEAVKIAFKKVFTNVDFIFESINTPSGVSDQPMSSIETLKGAKNRANYSFSNKQDNYFWIGIEGGIEKSIDGYEAFAWVYIKSNHKIGKARTAGFFLPKKIENLIDKGIELGDADDIVFGLKNSKKKNGAVGILTKNVTNRTKYYSEAVILALIPFVNNDLF